MLLWRTTILPCLLMRRWCFGLKTWPETMSLDCWCCSWVEAFSCSWMMGWSARAHSHPGSPWLWSSEDWHWWTSPSPPPTQLCYSGTSPSRPSAHCTAMLLLDITLPTPCTAMYYQGTSSPCKVAWLLCRSCDVGLNPYHAQTEHFHMLNYFLVRFLYPLQIFNLFFPP